MAYTRRLPSSLKWRLFLQDRRHTHTQSGQWDLIIAHPPCTHLAVSGARWFDEKRADGRQAEAIDFFGRFLIASCDKVAIENPMGIISGDYVKRHFADLSEQYELPRKPSQIIHPWQFGDNYEKTTCLWLKGIEPLIPITTEKPEMEFFEWIDKKTGRVKRQNMWYKDAWSLSPEERQKVRSKTFPGIAKAMAEQWGNPQYEQLRFEV